MRIPTLNHILPALAIFVSGAAFAGDLKIDVSVPADRQGLVMAAVFDKADGFPRGTPLRTATAKPVQGKATLQFTDLPKGDYAVTAFLDENSNTRLDANLFGIPTELYGFSRNARNMAGPPPFAEAAFRMEDNAQQQAFELK
ncbi:MAG TPA: DUF2141 domain-containing protein [Polaromonas sp.]|uniref:DUF2141 domain-containing protein n=1 Tax=Polaromonas sp. TaxID=1869339 RepID=UPI002D644209|nr:DUF2141 domain-containing protein [Polaromonas sp.]HYW56525.1 DUF2141 domain-containing protein [Polaromonas sp.]